MLTAACPYPVTEALRPPLWLRNPHVQSILATTFVRRGRIEREAAPLVGAARELLLDCGDGVRLQCFVSRPPQSNGRPVLVLHGWEGSAESIYVLSLARLLFERGFEVVRLNLRDHGETHHLNRELFHSCRLPEVIGAVRALQGHFPGRPLSGVGFSLGGNFLLRVATRVRESSLDLARIIAVSPVLEPTETLVALETAMPGYQGFFVRKWRRSLRKKQAAWPGSYDFAEVGGGLREMTAELVRRHSEFATLEEYLNGYSITGERLASLAVPADILTSLDDPMIPAGGLARLARPAALTVTVTRYGGHCGFIESLAGLTWAERFVLARLG
ncbi:MAG TPA: alpha/beta fold hydrolase [Steroidobacteraceae bacterium]|nr:alpha/beta fold hydrolase [Steroidobacteraceae bacterium]